MVRASLLFVILLTLATMARASGPYDCVQTLDVEECEAFARHMAECLAEGYDADQCENDYAERTYSPRED